MVGIINFDPTNSFDISSATRSFIKGYLNLKHISFSSLAQCLASYHKKIPRITEIQGFRGFFCGFSSSFPGKHRQESWGKSTENLMAPANLMLK
jgi:hypothetical protein